MLLLTKFVFIVITQALALDTKGDIENLDKGGNGSFSVINAFTHTNHPDANVMQKRIVIAALTSAILAAISFNQFDGIQMLVGEINLLGNHKNIDNRVVYDDNKSTGAYVKDSQTQQVTSVSSRDVAVPGVLDDGEMYLYGGFLPLIYRLGGDPNKWENIKETAQRDLGNKPLMINVWREWVMLIGMNHIYGNYSDAQVWEKIQKGVPTEYKFMPTNFATGSNKLTYAFQPIKVSRLIDGGESRYRGGSDYGAPPLAVDRAAADAINKKGIRLKNYSDIKLNYFGIELWEFHRRSMLHFGTKSKAFTFYNDQIPRSGKWSYPVIIQIKEDYNDIIIKAYNDALEKSAK